MRKRILKQCLDIAIKNNTEEKHPEWGNYHHFSFIIQDNKIVEWGVNRVGDPLTHFGYSPLSKIHAENDAMRKAKGILDKNKPFECVNIRLSKQNELKVSAPCECCYNFLKILGCKKAYFTTPVGFASVEMV